MLSKYDLSKSDIIQKRNVFIYIYINHESSPRMSEDEELKYTW